MSRYEDIIKEQTALMKNAPVTRAESILGGRAETPPARGRNKPTRNELGQNKMEESYDEHLCHLRREGVIYNYWWDPFTMKIGSDCRYRADFLVQNMDGTLELHETKGFMEDDALVKLKVVAAVYPFKVFLVKKKTKAEGGCWSIDLVKTW